MSWSTSILVAILVAQYLCTGGDAYPRQFKDRAVHGGGHRKNVKGSAACYINTATAWAECSYITASDIGMLQSSIANISAVDATFNVEVSESDGPSFPDNLFSGYNILEIDLEQCSLVSMPTALLGNVGPQLVTLDLSVNAITAISAVSAQYQTTIQSIDFSYNGATQLNDDAFSGYTGLTTLYLDQNALTTIGTPFAGLNNLIFLSVDYNSISSISVTAFQDLAQLQYLELSHNQLQTLSNGTFTALNNVVQLSLGGNPFDCTCDLQWLKDWLTAKNLLTKSKATCATPTVGPFSDVTFCP